MKKTGIEFIIRHGFIGCTLLHLPDLSRNICYSGGLSMVFELSGNLNALAATEHYSSAKTDRGASSCLNGHSITGWMTRQQVFATFDITAMRTWSKP